MTMLRPFFLCLGLSIFSPAICLAQSSISENICKNWEGVMINAVLGWRMDGIPVGNARKAVNSESDARTRYFLFDVVDTIYANPDQGRQYLRSGSFMRDCLKVHRGY